MATENSFHAEYNTLEETVFSDGLQCIFRTGWVKSAYLIGNKEGDKALIDPYDNFEHIAILVSVVVLA